MYNNRVSQIAFNIAMALLSGTVFANDVEHNGVENINGIPASNLAHFAYPDLPLTDALDILRSDYYSDPDRMAMLQHQYEASIDKSELDEKLDASLLPEALKEDMRGNPYLKAYYFQPRSSELTQTKYKDSPLFWDTLPVKNATTTGKVVGKVDAMSVLDNIGGFDLDLITQAQVGKPGVGAIDYLVVADYGLCGITTSIAARCRGIDKGTPMPMIYYNMLSDPISPRQQAMPPAPTSKVTPSNALGLYEQVKYYKNNVNPKAKLLLSISTDLRQVQDVGAVAKAIVTYMNTWGYDGVVFDRPDFSPTEDEGAGTYKFIAALKQQDPKKIVGIQLYGSHQFEDWDKEGVLALQKMVDFMGVSLNHYLDDEEISQTEPLMNIYGSHNDSYNANYERLMSRLLVWGVDTHKLVTNIDSQWRVRYYDGDLQTGWFGQISGTTDNSKPAPGTFTNGNYAFYDFDHLLANWQWVSGQYTLADYYQKSTDKLVASGNDRQMVSDKLVFGSAFNIFGAQIELDQDNGKLTAGVIDGINLQCTRELIFNGNELVILDNGQYKDLYNQNKYDLVDTNNGIQSSAIAPRWGGANRRSTITVPVVDDYGKIYDYHLLASKSVYAGSHRFEINAATSVSIPSRERVRNHLSSNISIVADKDQNVALPPGHYHSLHPVVIKTIGWHQAYNYGNPNQVFHTVNVNVDVNQ